VLKNKKNCKPSELKDFAKNKLARFKIPKNIYIVNEIPIGATGKIQRIGLAKKLGIE
jgi:acyl-CoA synthetase (AMP-forming)/AMP-acid ligase II